MAHKTDEELIGKSHNTARYFTEARAVHASAHPRVVPVRWAAETDEPSWVRM